MLPRVPNGSSSTSILPLFRESRVDVHRRILGSPTAMRLIFRAASR